MSTSPDRLESSRGTASRVAALVTALLLPGTALSWAWELVPQLSSDVTYESNPDNVSQQSLEDDAYIVSIGGTLKLSGRTPSSFLRVEPSLRLRQDYSNDSNNQLDGTDFNLPLAVGTRGRRSSTNLRAGYSLYPSRQTDYQVVNPNQPLPPGGLGCDVDIFGRCRIEEFQTYWYLSPTYTYDLTPRTQVSLNGQYSEVSYDEARLTGRFNYDYVTAGITVSHALLPKHRLNASTSTSSYDARQPGSSLRNETDTTNFSIGYEYLYSPTTSVNLSAGASYNDFEASGLLSGGLPCLDPVTGQFVRCVTKGEDSSFIGQLFLLQQLTDRITTRLGVSRQIQPTSDGAQVTLDSATAFMEREFGERLRASAGVTYIEQESIGSRTLIVRQRLDRTYARLELSLNWQLSKHWFLNSQFTYYTEDYDVSSNIAGSAFTIDSRNQIIQLGITYIGRTYR